MDNVRRARLQARILANIRVDGETGCWIWLMRKNNRGYAIITVRVPGYATPRPLFAHRVAYEAFRRGIPEGKVLAHDPVVCNRRDCVNPHHVRATSHSENNRDKARAKRYRERLAEPVHILRREVA